MAIELCSENCGVSSMSPRISFSQDFSQTDAIPVEQHPFRSNSSGLNPSVDFDFDFCVSESFELAEPSSADELFSDGKILPTEIKRKIAPLKQIVHLAKPNPPILPPPNTSSTSRKHLKKESPKEDKYLNNNEVVYDKQSSNKSFWSFKRSSSCGSGYRRSLCPLPLLSRSNSTGSSSNVKRNSSMSKEGLINSKQNSQKQSSTRFSPSPSYVPNNNQKPPLNKSYGSYGNSVRVSPILNVPSANLFGLSSIFSNNNRDRSKKK